ncbi:hypothetical protein, partial [Streptomyces sp. NPDC057910]|uniref:hypothetical protein n=1 Tax=Streptomyces sp. NPDC057910 TaxID=3346278 RepID=UPI0036E0A65B
MILLQILTGRRASEIRTSWFDCLSPVPDRAVDAAEGEQIARFHYAQSKINIAPDNILVDAEVVAVIEEQRRWLRDRFPGSRPEGGVKADERRFRTEPASSYGRTHARDET